MMRKLVTFSNLIALCLSFISTTGTPPLIAQAETASPWIVQPPTDYENAVNTVQDQLTALKMGDSSKAYYAYTTKDFRRAFSLEDYKALVRRFKVFSQNRSFQTENSEFDGSNIVKLKGKLISSDGDSMKVTYDVVLEDGDWKIQNIQLSQIIPRNKFKTLPGPRPQGN